MAALATVDDVEARLGRSLTPEETARTDPGLLEEASALVVGYLGCDPASPGPVPSGVRVVTSRMVARVLQQEGGSTSSGGTPVGAEQVTRSMGPFSETYGFGSSGAGSGAPWLGTADKQALKPYRCDGKAFAIDTAPGSACAHSAACSANRYVNVSHWQAYCTCGADVAGQPIYGSMP